MSSFTLKADTNLQAELMENMSRLVVKQPGQTIYKQGQKPVGLFLVHSGKVRVFLESKAGKTMLERTVGPGCLLGLPATINGVAYSVSAEAIDTCELALLSRRELIRLMRSNTSAALKLLDLLSQEIRFMRSEIANPKHRTHALGATA